MQNIPEKFIVKRFESIETYLGITFSDFAERRRQQEAKARAIANEKKLAKRKSQAIRAGFSSPL